MVMSLGIDQTGEKLEVATLGRSIEGEFAVVTKGEAEPDSVVELDLVGLRELGNRAKHEHHGFSCERLAGVGCAVDDVQAIDEFKLGRVDSWPSECQVAQAYALHARAPKIVSSARKSAVHRPMR